MAHTQKSDFVFQRKGRVHLNRRWRQFSRLQAAEVCASAVVMLDTTCSEVVWRVLATHSIRHIPLHFPSHASPCAIRFQTHSTTTDLKHITTTPDNNGIWRGMFWLRSVPVLWDVVDIHFEFNQSTDSKLQFLCCAILHSVSDIITHHPLFRNN